MGTILDWKLVLMTPYDELYLQINELRKNSALDQETCRVVIELSHRLIKYLLEGK